MIMQQHDLKKLTEQYAGFRPSRLCQLWGGAVRIVRIDGEDRPITAEFRQNRLNVSVRKGRVEEILYIG